MSITGEPVLTKWTVLLLVGIMVGVASVIGATTIGLLYGAATEKQRARLVESAQSRASMMEAVARFDAVYSSSFPGGSVEATLSQLFDAHSHFRGFGETGEFTLARREGDQIVFLLSHRHDDLEQPRPLPFSSTLAEPMRRALSGQSGSVVGLDYRGVEVLAAHEPVAELKLGIVAKIDMAEVRAPFLHAGLVAVAIAVATIIVGAVLFQAVGSPLARRIAESERRYRLLFENANDAIFIIDPATHRFLDVNENAAGYLGYSRKELLTLDIDAIHTPEAALRNAEVMEELRQNGKVLFEHTHRHKDGTEIPVEISARLVRNGERTVIQSIVRDITERRQAEKALRDSEPKFRLVAEHIPNVFWICTPNLDDMIYVSPAYETIWGRSCESLYRAPSSFLDPILPEDKDDVLRKLAENGGNEWDLEYRIARPDGSIRWIKDKGFPVRNAEGHVTLMAGLARDITHRVETEREVRRAKDEAELANCTKSEFLANMSHELRTPLNAILGFSDVMQEQVFGSLRNEKYEEYAHNIHESGQHLLELINDILDLSKVEAGALNLDEETVRLEELSEAAARLIRPRAENGRVTLENRINGNLPDLLCDQRRVKQILVNLLSNAVKFTDAGGRVDLSGHLEDDGTLSLVVSDTGVGMDDHELETALEAFGQVDGSLARKHEGTGLGLPLTRALVELHGGQMILKSRKNEGTEITVRFPAERVSRD